MVAVPEPDVIIHGVEAVALVMTRLLITTVIPIVPFLVESGFTVKLPVLFNVPVMEYTNDVGEKPAMVSTELPLLMTDKLGPLKLPLKVSVLVTLSATLLLLQLSLLLILYLQLKAVLEPGVFTCDTESARVIPHPVLVVITPCELVAASDEKMLKPFVLEVNEAAIMVAASSTVTIEAVDVVTSNFLHAAIPNKIRGIRKSRGFLILIG
jgi:hypothetical protein